MPVAQMGLGAVTGGSSPGEGASLGWAPAPRCSFLLPARNPEVKEKQYSVGFFFFFGFFFLWVHLADLTWGEGLLSGG